MLTSALGHYLKNLKKWVIVGSGVINILGRNILSFSINNYLT